MDKSNFKLKRIKEFEEEFLQQSSCSDRECQWTKDRCFHGTEDVMKDFICASMELAYEKAYQDAAKRFRMREKALQDSFRRKVEEEIIGKDEIEDEDTHKTYMEMCEGIENAYFIAGRDWLRMKQRAKLKTL